MPDIRLTAASALLAAAAAALPAVAAPETADAYAFGQRTLAQGMSGRDVGTLQELLRRTGARIAVDRAFGPATASALLAFERSAGLTVDARLSRAEARTLRREAAEAVAERRAARAGKTAAPQPGARATEGADDSPFAGGASPKDDVAPAAEQPGDDARAVFPIRGRHDLGQTATNRFGGGRGHEGQDMFARCGTPVVAAQGGTVTTAKWHSAAGNYVVITTPAGESHAYMHLRAPAVVKTGERVHTGERLGEVGDTGRATGCHLHFELWTAPGWYQGGRPVDPLPTLRRWDRTS